MKAEEILDDHKVLQTPFKCYVKAFQLVLELGHKIKAYPSSSFPSLNNSFTCSFSEENVYAYFKKRTPKYFLSAN